MGQRLILRTSENGVTTLTMNNPRKLNGWTEDMLLALRSEMEAAASDPETSVVILTGRDPYYCAGVNLSGALQLGHPRTLREAIVQRNRALFDGFIDFPKPILVAANGPAIGASVTSAALCDAIVASERATFSTPFARLGVTPEGCSSVLFPRLMGERNAERMLGPDDWAPTAAEAEAAGLVDRVVPHERLAEEAQRLARGWIDEGRRRTLPCGFSARDLKAINARESEVLADAFLSSAFLKSQFRFLWSKKKRQPAAVFLGLWALRPLWSRLL